MTESKTYLNKEEKLDISMVPTDPSAYSGWRDNVGVQILCNGYDAEYTEVFMDECDQRKDFHEILNTGLNSEMRSLDRKLYKTLYACMKGKENIELMRKAKIRAARGNGR